MPAISKTNIKSNPKNLFSKHRTWPFEVVLSVQQSQCFSVGTPANTTKLVLQSKEQNLSGISSESRTSVAFQWWLIMMNPNSILLSVTSSVTVESQVSENLIIFSILLQKSLLSALLCTFPLKLLERTQISKTTWHNRYLSGKMVHQSFRR